MMSQPRIEISSNATATAAFDPPAVRPGQEAVYRVSINALEASIEWPDKVNAPADLNFRQGGRGQVFQFAVGSYAPRTTFNYHACASHLGEFTVPEFVVNVYGQPVSVPAAKLEVVASLPASATTPQRLVFEVPETNLYVGQPVRARVLLPPAGGAAPASLMQVQINGEGVLADQGTARLQFTPVQRGAQSLGAFVYDINVTPLRAGKLTLFAQGFAVGNRFIGPTTSPGAFAVNSPQYTLVDSDPVELHARPLPRQGELPGFTGAIGAFALDPPRLSADVVRVGDTVKLFVSVRGTGNVSRLAAPPPPDSPDWQIFTAQYETPLAQPYIIMHGSVAPAPPPPGTFSYTLVPLTVSARATPPIPFSYFDPARAAYVDLTIPAMPITVQPGPTQPDLKALRQPDAIPAPEAEKELVLSGLASSRGMTAASLAPVQRRAWFPFVQLAPALAFGGIWGWDRRRRFLEQHPEVILRRRARRALRREWRALRQAARAGDAPRFAAAATAALRVACAPHLPAEPRALVAADVLPWLPSAAPPASGTEPALGPLGPAPEPAGPAAGHGEGAALVRRFFDLTDAARFGLVAPDARELLALQPELDKLLAQLERRLWN
jgi:hypothetical protein